MPSPAPDPDELGKEVLYLPISLHKSSRNRLSAEDFPFSSSDGIKGPLPDPIRRNGIEYPAELRCKPLHRAPISTKPTSSTKTAHKVKILTVSNQLTRMRRSHTLWQNLKAYAARGIYMGPNANPSFFREDVDHKGWFNTWTARGNRSVPPMKQQADAVNAISAWLGTHINSPEPIVNCEDSVQDQIQLQLMQPLGYILQV